MMLDGIYGIERTDIGEEPRIHFLLAILSCQLPGVCAWREQDFCWHYSCLLVSIRGCPFLIDWRLLAFICVSSSIFHPFL